MERVLILGCAGSGKSTFSRRLSEVTDLPVIHLDSLYWKPGWKASSNEEWDQTIQQLVKQNQYIMDGNYSRTLPLRLERADTVFFFDLPRIVCLYRVLKRRVMYHGRTRSDLNEGCPEKLDWKFISWIWNFKRKNRHQIMRILEDHKDTRNIHIIRSTKELEEYLQVNGV